MTARSLPVLSLSACVLGLCLTTGCRSDGDAPQASPDASAATAAPTPLAGTLPGQGSLPEITFESLRGNPVVFQVESRESLEKQQAKELRIALDRWEYPEGLRGFIVADARAFRFIPGVKDMAQEFMEAMRPELRLPMYADFSGDALGPLDVESGAFELVIVDEAGFVQHRHRGDATPEDIEAIKVALGAKEPASGPKAPAFTIGALNQDACNTHGCLLVFLGTPVALSDIPGIEEGGFEGSREEMFAQLSKPPVRVLSQVATRWDYEASPITGAIIGDAPGELLPAWQHSADDPALREAFGLRADSTAVVGINKEGVIVFRSEDAFPFWKLAQARHELGLKERPWGS